MNLTSCPMEKLEFKDISKNPFILSIKAVNENKSKNR